MKKGQASLGSVIGFIFVIIIYILGFAPVITSMIEAMTGVDKTTAFVLNLFVSAIFLALILGIFVHVFGMFKPNNAMGVDVK